MRTLWNIIAFPFRFIYAAGFLFMWMAFGPHEDDE